jgi:hypothetical protein
VFRPDAPGHEAALKRTRQALQSAVKYSLVANSIKSKLVIEPEIEVMIQDSNTTL